jgi:CHAD domain-containing protein
MKATVERELKLEADGAFVLPDLRGEPLESRVFTSTYYDTPDLSLARRRITMRRRVERGLSVWQLKLPANGDRVELEQRGGPAGPPEEMRELLTAHLRHGGLEPVASLRTRRSGVLVSEPATAEVTIDDVAIMEGPRVTGSFREIEVELRDGDPAGLAAIGDALVAAGAWTGEGRPKVFRALSRPLPAVPADPIRARLRAQVDELLAHDPGTRRGADPEDLHQHRVAVRRLRALLRTVRPLVDRDAVEPLRAELAWIGGLLGAVRDLDVLLEHLEDEAAGLDGADRRAFLPLLRRLRRERERDRAQLLAALDAERYFALLDALEGAAETLPVEGEERLPELAAKEFRKLRRDERQLGAAPSDEELHGLRIRGKRARYAAELLEGKRAARFVDTAKELQDVLGEHQDAIVAEARLRSLLGPRSTTAQAVAVGRLVERERVRQGDTRAGWPAVWKRLDRAGRKAWPKTS